MFCPSSEAVNLDREYSRILLLDCKRPGGAMDWD